MTKKLRLSVLLSTAIIGGSSLSALAKHAVKVENDNMAVIIGNAGESYPVYGTGGIKVSGGHHGMWASNMKSSQIEIDGSGIAAPKTTAVSVNEDFTAVTGGAYFAYKPCVCILSSAVEAPGQEITICNANRGVSITYQTLNGEALIGVNKQGLLLVNNNFGQVDKFISDGKSWFKE